MTCLIAYLFCCLYLVHAILFTLTEVTKILVLFASSMKDYDENYFVKFILYEQLSLLDFLSILRR